VGKTYARPFRGRRRLVAVAGRVYNCAPVACPRERVTFES